MRRWYTPVVAAAGCALLAVPLLAFARPDDRADDDKDKAQARKEIKDLEEQRAKIDSRIRDLRKKAGLPGGARAFVFGDGKLEAVPGVDGDHRIIIEKALGEAHKSVEEALKNIPNFEKFDFNLDDKNGHRNIIINKDGKTYKYNDNMSEEDKKKFKEAMEKMHIQLRENLKGLKELKELKGLEGMKEFKFDMPEIHAFGDGKAFTPRIITPQYRVVEPRIRGGAGDDNRALRDEIRSLREEVEKLRDEVKKGRGGRSSENLDRFDNTNFL